MIFFGSADRGAEGILISTGQAQILPLDLVGEDGALGLPGRTSGGLEAGGGQGHAHGATAAQAAAHGDVRLRDQQEVVPPLKQPARKTLDKIELAIGAQAGEVGRPLTLFQVQGIQMCA